MEQEELNRYEELYDLYKKSRMICYGSPDQFQYRQNELLQKVAEIILLPYWKCQNKELEENEKEK